VDPEIIDFQEMFLKGEINVIKTYTSLPFLIAFFWALITAE